MLLLKAARKGGVCVRETRTGTQARGALITMSEMREGERGILYPIAREHALYDRLCNLGWRAGVEVVCVRRSPRGSPIAYRACDVTIALRAVDASAIFVQTE